MEKFVSENWVPLMAGLIVAFCLVNKFFDWISQRWPSPPKKTCEFRFDDEIVRVGVNHFSKPENMIPDFETSIGRNMSAFYVHKILQRVLKMKEREVMLADSNHDHAFKIIEQLEENGVIVFEKAKQYA